MTDITAMFVISVCVWRVNNYEQRVAKKGWGYHDNRSRIRAADSSLSNNLVNKL